MWKLSARFAAAFAIVALGIMFSVQHAAAQSYPSKPIRLVVAYPPGGGTDVVARILAKQLETELGQSVFVDNRGGANAIIGTTFVARSPPDGYTLIVVSGTPFVINQVVFRGLTYDVISDFEPIGLFTSQPLLLLVNPAVPANTLQDFVKYAKSQRDPLSYAGSDQFTHLTMEMIKTALGISMTYVPYKGGGPAIQDVIGGHTTALLATVAVSLPHIKAAKLKPLAITSAQRSAQLPDVPALAEGAMSGFDVGAWFGLMAPRGTPPEIVAKLNAALTKAAKAPEVKDRFDALGGDTNYLPPAQFKAFLQTDLNRWKKAAEQAGVQPEQL